MVRSSVMLTCILGALALAGCGGRSNTLPDYESGAEGGGAAEGADTRGADGRGIGVFEEEGAAGGQQALLDQLIVYFEYDQSEVPAQYNEMLAAHGRYLSSNPEARIRLEGHADERGSREYNIGLGERRSQAVRRILMLQGASAEQLSTVSYGEERPAALGSDEEAYSLNRRVEIVYRQ
ncbi:MAG: peptidoglycan-associated lipoprotein Pal [Gammaproteobacteria bacterium]|nr:peptidoglycan-associated lipoprotein Pal [Gammaproteobacteria bacterium]